MLTLNHKKGLTTHSVYNNFTAVRNDSQMLQALVKCIEITTYYASLLSKVDFTFCIGFLAEKNNYSKNKKHGGLNSTHFHILLAKAYTF